MNAPSLVSSSDITVNHVSDATRIDSALQTANDKESNKRRGDTTKARKKRQEMCLRNKNQTDKE